MTDAPERPAAADPEETAAAWLTLVAVAGAFLVVGLAIAGWNHHRGSSLDRWQREDLVRFDVDFSRAGRTSAPVVLAAEPVRHSAAVVLAVDGPDHLPAGDPLSGVEGWVSVTDEAGEELTRMPLKPGEPHFRVRGTPVVNLSCERLPPGRHTLIVEVTRPAPEVGRKSVFGCFRLWEMALIPHMLGVAAGSVVAAAGLVPLLCGLPGLLRYVVRRRRRTSGDAA